MKALLRLGMPLVLTLVGAVIVGILGMHTLALSASSTADGHSHAHAVTATAPAVDTDSAPLPEPALNVQHAHAAQPGQAHDHAPATMPALADRPAHADDPARADGPAHADDPAPADGQAHADGSPLPAHHDGEGAAHCPADAPDCCSIPSPASLTMPFSLNAVPCPTLSMVAAPASPDLLLATVAAASPPSRELLSVIRV